MKHHIYILDFGAFFKIGRTKIIKDRLKMISNKIEQELTFEESFVYVTSEALAIGIESAILQKYKDFSVGHPASPREIFPAAIKDFVIQDIGKFHDLFDLNINVFALSDRYECSYNENRFLHLKSIHFLPEFLPLRKGEII